MNHKDLIHIVEDTIAEHPYPVTRATRALCYAVAQAVAAQYDAPPPSPRTLELIQQALFPFALTERKKEDGIQTPEERSNVE